MNIGHIPVVCPNILWTYTSLNQNGNKVEYHSNTLEEANVKANNALVTNNSNPLISIESLDVLNFFEDPNEKIDHLISGGVIGPDN